MPSPGTEWPPPACADILAQLDVYDAWYTGDRERLAHVYGGQTGYDNPTWRSFDHPSQHRGGVVGSVARWFWGEPRNPQGGRPNKLHVPVGADIATTSAGLLFAEPPTITAADEPSQARLDELLDDHFWATVTDGAELESGLGGVYFRVGWDVDVTDRPIVDDIGADLAIPTFRFGRLTEVTFTWELSRENSVVLRHLEHHSVGRVEHALFRGTDTGLGQMIPLAEHPQTEGLVGAVDAQGVVWTGLDRIDVAFIPGLPSRKWRRHPLGSCLGQPDIAGVEPLMDALDEAWCVDETTEILTDHGWSSYRDLRAGDPVLTLNHETGLSEWQPVQEVCVFPAQPREMLSMEQRGHSSLTTPNHRWPVLRGHYRRERDADGEKIGRYKSVAGHDRTWATTETLKYEDLVPVAADCADLPDQAKYTDAFVEATAWFWTEGHIRKLRSGRPGRNVTITQAVKAVDNCDRMRAAFRRAFGEPCDLFPRMGKAADTVPRWRQYTNGDKQEFVFNAAAGQSLQEVAPGRVPTWHFLLSLTRAQLELFIGVSMLADNSGQRSLAQKSRPAAEAFQFACVLAGYGTSMRNRDYRNRGYEYDMSNVRIRSERVLWAGRAKLNAESVIYGGEVWCPRTPNQTWLARRNGTVYFTGNTSWMRDLRLGKSRVVISDAWLSNMGPGKGASFNLDQELFARMNVPPTQDAPLQLIQPAIRHEEHAATCTALLERIIAGAGYSAQTFGLTGEVAMTATESNARERKSHQTRGAKIRRWAPGLADLVEIMLAVDALVFGSGNAPGAPMVEFPPAATDGVETLAKSAQMLRAAEAASTETLVRLTHPGLDDDELAAEVALIEKEREAALPPLLADPTDDPNTAGDRGTQDPRR